MKAVGGRIETDVDGAPRRRKMRVQFLAGGSLQKPAPAQLGQKRIFRMGWQLSILPHGVRPISPLSDLAHVYRNQNGREARKSRSRKQADPPRIARARSGQRRRENMQNEQKFDPQ